jgi:hypothetical protein
MGTERIENRQPIETSSPPRNLTENITDHLRKGLLSDPTSRELQQSYFKVFSNTFQNT